MLDNKFFIKNRNKFIDKLEDNSVTILSSGKEIEQSLDSIYEYYPDNNFYYLTGLKEPNNIFIITKKNGKVTEDLFIPRSDPEREKWVGYKYSKKEASNISGLININYLDKLPLKEYLDLSNSIGLDLTQKPHQRYLNPEDINDKNIIDIGTILQELRLIKEKDEIDEIKEAISITDKGIKEILKNLSSSNNEKDLANLFAYSIKKNGADSLSFPTIAASGKNGVILHYEKNNMELNDGDLILFDLGSRLNGYCADISRTFPINGKFSPLQKKIYKIVLETQKELIKNYKSGVKIRDLQQLTQDLYIEKLQKEGIKLSENGINDWYYHNIGHSLGLDTHDSLTRDLTLKDGMVITCEPGLYIKEYNIGIRIEDDILINGDNPINLSESIPKEIDEIYKLME